MDFVTKIDHVLNARHALFARISKGYQNTNCDSGNGGEPPFPGLTCLVNTKRSPFNWAGNYRWNPTGALVNEVVVGQNHFTFDFQNPSSDPRQPTFSFGRRSARLSIWMARMRGPAYSLSSMRVTDR